VHAVSILDATNAQPHEFDTHLHFTENGLKPYYVLDSARKKHDWDGEPAAEISVLERARTLYFDYDKQPLRP
jgi:hypothetical protein